MSTQAFDIRYVSERYGQKKTEQINIHSENIEEALGSLKQILDIKLLDLVCGAIFHTGSPNALMFARMEGSNQIVFDAMGPCSAEYARKALAEAFRPTSETVLRPLHLAL